MSTLESFRLTNREQEVVELVCQGLQDKQVATSLSITTGTVKNYLQRIFYKCNAQNRSELVYIYHGLIVQQLQEENRVLREENDRLKAEAQQYKSQGEFSL